MLPMALARMNASKEIPADGPIPNPPPFKIHPDDMAYVRDSLGAIVGSGYNGITDDGTKARMQLLQNILGPATTRKIITHALLFNQRDDIQGKGPAERIQQFYDLNHSDKEIDGLVKQLR